MKTNGATWKAYLASWPSGQWFEDSDEHYDGEYANDDLNPPDTAVVEFTCGVVYKDEKDIVGTSLVSHFKKWQKRQTQVTMICTVPKDRLAEFDAFLKTIKGTHT